jgi:hypothetical protein
MSGGSLAGQILFLRPLQATSHIPEGGVQPAHALECLVRFAALSLA